MTVEQLVGYFRYYLIKYKDTKTFMLFSKHVEGSFISKRRHLYIILCRVILLIYLIKTNFY